MGENTKIEWATHTFNPWVGCAKVSPACTHCYAEGWARRTGSPELWRGERRRTSASNWRGPLRWNEETPGARVFCASLADVFEDREDLVDWRMELFDLISRTPRLTWLLLTKRPEMAARWFRHPDMMLDNIWVGTTVENQATADERIPHLLRIPARVRFLSCEPLLGPVDLGTAIGYSCAGGDGSGCGWHGHGDDARGDDYLCPTCGGETVPVAECAGGNGVSPPISWVIAGGESGPRARPSHPAWFRDLRDQCVRAGVAFHFKQHGEWLPESEVQQRADADLDADVMTGALATDGVWAGEQRMPVYRVGKARAGRLLDGRTWDELPAVTP